MPTYKAKFRAGNRLIPVTIEQTEKRLYFDFGYNKILLDEIKAMEGRKWHGNDEINPRKSWSIPITDRNMFQLNYLLGNNPYAPYDQPLPVLTFDRPLREVQKEMVAHGMTRRQCGLGCEMGTGKTLALIEIMERSGATDWFYVAPRSALRAVELEFRKWKAKIMPRFYTYEGVKRIVNEWIPGVRAPQGIIFDEMQRLKTPTAQRSQACKHLADSVRQDWGKDAYVIGASGSPAPKAPSDWWHLCEVLCPGFLKEGDLNKFRARLGILEQKETAPGAGSYLQLRSWRDDERKCDVCGEYKDHPDHDSFALAAGLSGAHLWKPSVNEVAKLYGRMNGLWLVKLKKDCLDLPDKQYQIIKCKPTQSMLNALKIIKLRAKNTITALTLMRELSDGFQYEDIEAGTDTCPLCHGNRTYIEYYDKDDPDNPPSNNCTNLGQRAAPCVQCSATGVIVKTNRVAKYVPSPKEDVLRDLLDQHEDVGRLVVYGGFQGTVDKITEICRDEKWTVIRADGRGWFGQTHQGDLLPNKKLLEIFQYEQLQHPKVCFVGQAGAAGTGLTLTASPSIFYYSNSFDGEARIQSEDRIHRLGMDVNRGATIYDVFHLPTDELIYNNLKKKKELQYMSMGEIDEFIREAENADRLF